MSKYFLPGLRGYPRAAVHPQQLLAGGGGGDEDLLHPAGESVVNDGKMVSCDCWTPPGGGESASGDVAPAASAREENQSL